MVEPRTADRINAVIRDVTGSMIAVGKNIVQIKLTFNLHGIPLFRMPTAARPEPRLRPLPIKPPPPRRFRDLLDRDAEIGAATAAVQSATPTQIYGPPGVGKTVLLQHLAYHEAAARLPDGVVHCNPLSHEDTAVDLLQAVFAALYEFPESADGPVKPSDAILRQWLRERQALVMLDLVELGRDDAEGLLDAAPNCTFIIASSERSLWGEARAIGLGGLPLDAAVKLLERRGLERPLRESERGAAEALCNALSGHPLSILQASALVREGGRALDEVAAALTSDRQGLASELRASFSDKERTILSLLVALRGATVGVEHVEAITQVSDVERVLDSLRLRFLAQAHSPRYSAESPAEQIIREDETDVWAERAIGYFGHWAEDRQATPSLILPEMDAIIALLRWAVGAGRWAEVARLARAIDGALALGLRWGAWAQVLRWAYQAARHLGDRALEAWALHQQGSQALCLDDPAEAQRALTEALRIREALGDDVGAEVTRHNLDLLLGPPPPDKQGKPPQPPAPPRIRLVTALLAAIVVLTLAVGGVTARNRLMRPILQASVSKVEFQPREVGTLSDPVRIEIRNVGRSRLQVFQVELVGPDARDFRMTPGSCASAPIPAGAACQATVAFAPARAGVRSTTLRVSHNARGSPREISLSGTALVVRGLLAVTPASVDFGELTVGRSGAPRRIVLENRGRGVLTIRRVQLAGMHIEDFRIAEDRCTDGRLAPRGTCALAVAFGPTSQGDRTARLVITHDGANNPAVIALSGRAGVPSGVLRVIPGSVDFGAVPIGQSSRARRIAIQNRGDGPLTVTAIERSGPHPGAFRVSGACARPIAPRTECVLSVSFLPSAEGVRSARLSVATSVGSAGVDLRGEGQRPLVGSLEVAPGALRFGDLLLGDRPPSRAVTLSNRGTGPVAIREITVAGAGFDINHRCVGTLNAGASCEITATFRPPAEGRYFATISITHSAGAPRVVEVSGAAQVASARILTFLPEPSEITRGQVARLCWSTENAQSGRIDPDNILLEAREVSRGCREIRPGRTTQYTLTVAGRDGREVSASTTVIVRVPLLIRDFSATPPAIGAGGTSTLCWSVINADRVRIDPDVGEVDPRNFEKGCARTSPRATTTYTLRATGAGVQVDERRVTISVSVAAPTVEIRAFTAIPNTVAPGGMSVLCWSVLNAERARVDPVVGELNPQEFEKGCRPVFSRQTTTYTLTASDSKGRVARRQAIVTVKQETTTLTAPRPISPGSLDPLKASNLYPCRSVVLSWGSAVASVALEYQVVLQRQNLSTRQWEAVRVPTIRTTQMDVTRWLTERTTYRWSVMAIDSSGRRSPASQFLYFSCPIG